MIVTVVSDRNGQVRRHCLLLTGQENALLHGSMPGLDTQSLAISSFAREHAEVCPGRRPEIQSSGARNSSLVLRLLNVVSVLIWCGVDI